MRLLTTTLALALLAGTAEAQVRIQFGGQRPTVGRPVVRTYVFGARSHLDDLANTLRSQLRSVCLEMHHNYQGNPGYRETYAEAYEMWQLSEHIHELVHDRYHATRHEDEDHIAEDLASLDDAFHHVEDDIANWRPTHGHGHHHHHHGVGTRGNLHTLMAQTEQTLHHAMDDYGYKSRFGAGDPPAPGGIGNPPPPR